MKVIKRLLSHLRPLLDKDLEYFRSLLSPANIQTSDLDFYNEDWLKEHKGRSKLVLKPVNAIQISQILSYCNKEKLGIVPQGGNTGLTAGGVPIEDEVVLSLRNLNKIDELDETQGIVWCGSGVVLETLNNYCSEKGWIVPLDLASKGSCFIGGNVASNAGGVRYIKYGSLHGNTLGLEVVLPSGEILSDLKGLRKDNTGYDLKQLFIGSEGTLGVITRLALLLSPKPMSTNTVFLACNSYSDVVSTLIHAKQSLGEILSAYEFLDQTVFNILMKHLPGISNPFQSNYNFYVLLETSGHCSVYDTERVQGFLEKSFLNKLVVDGVIAQNGTQANDLWKIREGTALATRKAAKYLYKFDVSLRIPQMYSLVEKVRKRLEGYADVMGYGHVGDGNLHLTIVSQSTPDLKSLVDPYVYQEVQAMNGSISAEHGIGLFKRGLIKYTKDETNIKYLVSTI